MEDQWKSRLVRTGFVPASELESHPMNWRIHSTDQRAAMNSVFNQVGWVQFVIVSERTNRILDGHLRVDMARQRDPDFMVPVAWIDASEDEEAIILSTFDPLSMMAGTDYTQLDTLISSVHVQDQGMMELLESIRESYQENLEDMTRLPSGRDLPGDEDDDSPRRSRQSAGSEDDEDDTSMRMVQIVLSTEDHEEFMRQVHLVQDRMGLPTVTDVVVTAVGRLSAEA